ncbi:hypothetical protein Z043_120243, partial [Scleropages formosus]
PQYNGKFCTGTGRLYQLCNGGPCPPGGVDFRSQQCAEYNSKPFRGWYYKWKPYTKVEEYYPVVTIPAGARSIHVHEMDVSNSYLAVRSLKRKYYLTGDWTVDWPGKFQFAGTMFHYRRAFSEPESLYALGPTNETLVFELNRSRTAWFLNVLPAESLDGFQKQQDWQRWSTCSWFKCTDPSHSFSQILLQGKNPGVMWEYTLPKTEKKHNYTWVVVRSDCSAPCAGAGPLTSGGHVVALAAQASRLVTSAVSA